MVTKASPLEPIPARRPTGQFIIPSYAGSPTQEQLELIEESQIESASRKASLKAAREEAQRESARLKAGRNDTSYKKSPMTKAIEEQRRIALGGFTPTTPEEVAAYDLAIKQQPTFTSPAQAYMLQRELERESYENDFPATLLSPPKLASEILSDATKRGLDAGQQVAEEGNISGLLGNIDWRGLLGVLGRPEFLQPGLSPAQAFVNASFAQRQAEAAGAAEQQKLAIELEKERLKSAPKPPKPSSEITQLYTKIAAGQQSLKALNKMQGLISGGITTGGAALGIDFVTDLAAAFGINIGETDKTNLNRQVDRVRAALIASRAFGREANKQEQKLIENLLPKGATFTNVDELRNAYRDFQAYIENDVRVASGILQRVYQLPAYSDAVPDNIPPFRRGD